MVTEVKECIKIEIQDYRQGGRVSRRIRRRKREGRTGELSPQP